MTATLANNELRQLLLANRSKEKEIVLDNYTFLNYRITGVPYVKYANGIGPDGEKEYIQAKTMYKIDQLLEYMEKENIWELPYSFEI